jgi:hypothetical protein
VYFGGVFNRVNKFNEPKTPYLLTLALSKFLLEFTKQPIRSGSRSVKSNYPRLRQLNIRISRQRKVDINSKLRENFYF